MKTLRLTFAASLVALALTAGAATNTAPVGYLTHSFPATATATTTYLSAPLATGVAFSGKVTAVGVSTLGVATAAWQVNEFVAGANGSGDSYVHFLSGAQAGRVLRITANAASELTLDTTDGTAQTTALTLSGFAVAVGDAFEISAALTLRTAFGDGGGGTFPGEGTSLATAGGIGLWNAALRVFEYFFWSSAEEQWVKDGASPTLDAGDTLLPPNATLAIFRPAGQAADALILTGRAATVAPLLKHPGSAAVRYFGMHVPVAVTLSQLALGSGWTRGTSAFTADTLSIPDGTAIVNGVVTSKWTAYFQRPDGEWRKSGSTASQNAVSIPAGTAVAFTKRTAVSGSASFLPLPLPYTP